MNKQYYCSVYILPQRYFTFDLLKAAHHLAMLELTLLQANHKQKFTLRALPASRYWTSFTIQPKTPI